MLSIGLMSGTSMDGIDAALLETNGSPCLLKPLGEISLFYDQQFKILLKSAEYAIRSCGGDLTYAKSIFPQLLREYLTIQLKIPLVKHERAIAELQHYLCQQSIANSISLAAIIKHSTYLHSVAVKKLLAKYGFQAKDIDVIGYHGQTMLHQPMKKISLVLGDGQYLANDLQIKVVSNFRDNDMAFGGQGAPLAPLYHQALAIRDQRTPIAIVNCGGIANISLVMGKDNANLFAFDTGPGNGLVDRLVRLRTAGQENMDKDGIYGLQGVINETILQALTDKSIIQDGCNYLQKKPPKALDIGDMLLIPELEALSLSDACATLEAFTASCIVSSLELISLPIPTCWVLAGGGWNNPMIRRELERCLQAKTSTKISIMIADQVGWSSQAMEAQIFAFLAVRSLQGQPLSLPGTTGVSKPVSGGETYYPQEQTRLF